MKKIIVLALSLSLVTCGQKQSQSNSNEFAATDTDSLQDMPSFEVSIQKEKESIATHKPLLVLSETIFLI